jgi:hypothetical protein
MQLRNLSATQCGTLTTRRRDSLLSDGRINGRRRRLTCDVHTCHQLVPCSQHKAKTVRIKLNSVFETPEGYAPPLPSAETLASPQDLAEILVYDRSYTKQMLGNDWNAPLTENGLRRLVDIVFFYTSLSRDEGKFLRFVAALEAEKTIFNVASFAPVRLVSPGSLLRLAPAAII